MTWSPLTTPPPFACHCRTRSRTLPRSKSPRGVPTSNLRPLPLPIPGEDLDTLRPDIGGDLRPLDGDDRLRKEFPLSSLRLMDFRRGVAAGCLEPETGGEVNGLDSRLAKISFGSLSFLGGGVAGGISDLELSRGLASIYTNYTQPTEDEI